MGVEQVVMIEKERLFILPAASTGDNVLALSENHAVDIRQFQSITVYVRVKKSATPPMPTGQSYTTPTPSIGSDTTGSVFYFAAAHGLAYPDEFLVAGSRWATLGTTLGTQAINVTSNTNAATNVALGGTGSVTFTNPGAWLIWAVQNSGAATYCFVADIYLVGRGY